MVKMRMRAMRVNNELVNWFGSNYDLKKLVLVCKVACILLDGTCYLLFLLLLLLTFIYICILSFFFQQKKKITHTKTDFIW
jgi:hypothetical protein